MPLQKKTASFFFQRYCLLRFSLGNVSARQMAEAFQEKTPMRHVATRGGFQTKRLVVS
jgi:hypothetical protein